jgi:predicted alpha/beta-fold hydrolase
MIIQSDFRPLWWLRNPHLQTLWPVFLRRRPPLDLRWERLELSDGDFVDLAWHDARGPLVLVLHGLEGSLHSHYAAAVMAALAAASYHAVFMHFRGCSGEPNRLDRAYHSGDTADVARVAEHAAGVAGKALYAVVGYSLGGNVLLKWLGEQGEGAPLATAVAVSVPFRLADGAERMSRGLSRIYERHLVGRLRKSYRRKFRRRQPPLDIDIDRIDGFWAFDGQVTAPLHGFRDVHDYYRRSSSRQYLGAIRRPTLILHAADDPFMFPDTVPTETEISESVMLELAGHGGHVGFIGGRLMPEYWLEGRILSHLDAMADSVPLSPFAGRGTC